MRDFRLVHFCIITEMIFQACRQSFEMVGCRLRGKCHLGGLRVCSSRNFCFVFISVLGANLVQSMCKFSIDHKTSKNNCSLHFGKVLLQKQLTNITNSNFSCMVGVLMLSSDCQLLLHIEDILDDRQ